MIKFLSKENKLDKPTLVLYVHKPNVDRCHKTDGCMLSAILKRH